jgi:hypothetical protein
VEKGEVYNLRWSAELRERTEEYAIQNGYKNVASLIREAIEEKIEFTDNERDRMFKEKIRSALQEDPSLLDESLKRIGIRFYARK